MTAQVTTAPADTAAASPEEFTARLRALGDRYHDRHPFHVAMNEGRLDRDQLRRWVANRFYYQSRIPMKDAAILANCPEPQVRRVWIGRILDHDGRPDSPGGIERWLRLGEAIGVPREEMLSERHVLPGVRYAVDAYVDFCRRRPWIEAVASSLTELFGPGAMRVRVARMEEHYPWISRDGLAYFRDRLVQAPADADHALSLVLERCRTAELQDRAVAALAFKCDLLWAQLDAIAAGDTRPEAAAR
ncbi:pyrroloquinoline-quinone synthase PqqC [Actinomadura miaoliensis]|uniref:Pyrroloquinoline-quinone synthase n=1 Tax=Actinomadura miaoliensis TaxID=430685 RepID=A0ABP7W3I3_9ACTN